MESEKCIRASVVTGRSVLEQIELRPVPLRGANSSILRLVDAICILFYGNIVNASAEINRREEHARQVAAFAIRARFAGIKINDANVLAFIRAVVHYGIGIHAPGESCRGELGVVAVEIIASNIEGHVHIKSVHTIRNPPEGSSVVRIIAYGRDGHEFVFFPGQSNEWTAAYARATDRTRVNIAMLQGKNTPGGRTK